MTLRKATNKTVICRFSKTGPVIPLRMTIKLNGAMQDGNRAEIGQAYGPYEAEDRKKREWKYE